MREISKLIIFDIDMLFKAAAEIARTYVSDSKSNHVITRDSQLAQRVNTCIMRFDKLRSSHRASGVD